MTHDLIITAAGSGTRFGSNTNKVLIRWLNKSILRHAFEKLFASGIYNRVVITCREEDQESIAEELSGCQYNLVLGGSSRTKSVRNAIAWLSEREPAEFIHVHDGSRPNINQCILDSLIETLKSYPAAAPAYSPVETVRILENGILRLEDRSQVYLFQTPQVFSRTLISNFLENNDFELTDEMAVLSSKGIPFGVSEGDPDNIKVTYPEDLIRLKRISSIID